MINTFEKEEKTSHNLVSAQVVNCGNSSTRSHHPLGGEDINMVILDSDVSNEFTQRRWTVSETEKLTKNAETSNQPMKK